MPLMRDLCEEQEAHIGRWGWTFSLSGLSPISSDPVGHSFRPLVTHSYIYSYTHSYTQTHTHTIQRGEGIQRVACGSQRMGHRRGSHTCVVALVHIRAVG
eukprot:6790989-Prymnesium_polylepis.1